MQLGGLVGYAVRFEDRCSSETRIKYLTGVCVGRPLLHLSSLFPSSCPHPHLHSSPHLVLFVDGTLLKECLEDPQLSRYSVSVRPHALCSTPHHGCGCAPTLSFAPKASSDLPLHVPLHTGDHAR